jgi:transglutaminase-like putative cysteine protease
MGMRMRSGTWGDGTAATELTQNVNLRISFRGDRFSLKSEQTAWIDDDWNLLGSRESIDFGAGKWETRAILTGERRYEVAQFTLGGEKRETVTLPKGVLAAEALPLYLHRFPGEEGKRTELTVYNMSLGQEIPFTYTNEGATPFGTLFSVTYWGMSERIWLDAEGMVSREEMALGVQARALQEQAEGERTAWLALETILVRTAVPAVKIPGDLGSRGEVQLVLEGSFQTPPSGKWQKVKMDGNRALVRLVRPTVPTAEGRSADAGMMPPDEFALDLDSPRIRELAMEITEGLDDPWEKSVAVGRWVNENLGKSMVECFSALHVLETGEGECQSHSLLAVALSRAAGIPARFAYGVVYLPDDNAYFFHTWVEVYVGDWIPIDPTLGSFPAGVDHLTLVVGGYRDQFRVFPFIMSEGGWRISMEDPR